MRKNRFFKMFFALAVMTAMCVCITVSANTMLNYNGSMYSLVQKSEKDFSDGKYTGNTNGIGTLDTGVIDEEHGQSVILGANAGTDSSREGTWMQIDGDKTLPLSVYEFEMYVEKMESGKIKFAHRGVTSSGGIVPFYNIEISNGKINNEYGSADFAFGKWHTVRILYDCSDHIYTVYVDDMQNDALSGNFSAGAVGMMFMRICLYASDAKVAIDNAKVYSMVKLIDGYETPKLSLKLPAESITESSEAQIEAEISTAAEIEKVDFYVDEKLVSTDSEKPYILNYLFEKGDHTVRAVATDIYGASGECTQSVTSYADTKPKITTELSDGGEYDKTELGAVAVSVTMTDAELAKGTVSADGNVVAELKKGDNTVDLSVLSIGQHKITIYAENNLGESAQKSAEITVTRTFDDVVWSADFNDGNKTGFLNGDGQFIRLETLRDDFKESCLVGANTEQDVSREGAWIPVEFKDTKTVVIADMDIYMNRITGNGMTGILNLSASYRPKLFGIDKNGITPVDDSAAYKFEAGRWYHIKLMIDSQNTSYTLWLDDEPIFTNIKIPKMDAGSALNSMRLISKLQGTEESYFAVDNMVVRQLTLAPTIENITSENGSRNVVSTKDTVVKVYFSGALQPTSVYASKFTVDGANVKKAEYNASDFCVTLTLDAALAPGAHRVTVAENLVMGNGSIYAEKLYGNFEVKDTILEVVNAERTDNKVSAAVRNNTEDTQKVYVIANIYSGDALRSSSANVFELKAGENAIDLTLSDYKTGDIVEVFFWDSLKSPACIFSIEN